MNMKIKKVFSMFLALLMVCSVVWTNFTPATAEAATPTRAASSTSQYGLQDNVQDGLILHCWDWSFNNIAEQMETIAKSGYSAIQTSPIQEAKERTKGVSNFNWWVFYQPKSFVIDNSGDSGLGTKAEFENMCRVAHSYGIKVIVDIVANHTGNGGANGIANTVIDDIKNDPNCYHNYGNFREINYGNRYSITHDSMGLLPDLNTENTKIQNYVLGLLKECIDAGADGFRFDAAKHISVPSEGSEYTFWPNTVGKAKEYAATKGIDLYCYGEILDGTSGPAMTDYTQYMSVTDNATGNDIRKSVANHNASGAASSYYQKGVAANKLVLWAESHDTFQNDDKISTAVSTSDINKTWALVASRANATALYYVRTTGWRTGTIGDICTWDWKTPQVAEVNKFHNAFVGQTEYLSSSGSIAYNERGTSGVVLVNCSGNSQSVSVAAHKMAAGTYKDQVSGNTFKVENGMISGQIGDTGIAVVYNAGPIITEPTPTISKEGGTFSTDTLTLTLGLRNATSGTYKIGNGTTQTYTSTKSITIGSDMAYGDSITITLTATDGSQTSSPATYTFTKQERTGNVAYLSLPSGWGSTVYCYAYDSATETINNHAWPGEQMTLDSATGYYKYEIPENIEAPRVIFYNSDANRTPADMIKGYLFSTNGSYLYKDGNWSVYTPVVNEGKVIVRYVNEAGVEISPSKTIKGAIGSSYTTTAASVNGYTLKTTPSNASGRYTAADITVTYIYASSGEPVVTSSLASGSTFNTETKTITLTLGNAVSGTYSVDNGPVKSFTNSASVVLGQGKVADSTVTVQATAKASNGTTKSYTFTYKKQFNGTVNEEGRMAASTYNAASSSRAASSNLATQYSTNKAGVGVEKTISVDGDISDWNASMKIAQGAANDDPRVYRPNSMYENPVDLYALYAAYDDNNLYLMWEMTNVQDVVAPADNYPLSQGTLWQTQEFPFFIAIDTGKTSDAIGNKGALQTGGTIWNSGMTIQNSFNKLISINTKGGNGPFVYGGNSSGLNPVEILDATTSKIKMNFGKGILTSDVTGINGAYGENNNRVVGDVSNNSADWVDFNTKGHNSASMDFFYELSIPYDELGITKNDVKTNGIGVLLVATMGKSPMDCLPYDTSMNDNADLDDSAGSQENNSFEKSDEDYITCSFARVGKSGGNIVITDDLELNFGADRSSPQAAGTALTLKGIASGGTGPYTYKYYVNNALVATKSGSGETQTAWTPSAAGTYMIKCVATDSAGNSVTSAKKYVVEGTSSTLTGSLTGNNSTAAISNRVGDRVSLTASAFGGAGSYTYKFLVNNVDTGAWSVLQDYSSNSVYTWSAGSTGNRKFYVDIKDGNGTVVRSNAISVSTSNTASELKITGRASAASVSVGTNVTFTGTATGGSGSYSYSYIMHNKDTNDWYRFSDFTGSNTLTWTASSAGNREFFVEVKDSTGKVVRSTAMNVSVISSNPLSVTGRASATMVSVGTNVVFVGMATGGNGSYSYSYIMHNKDTNDWYRFSDFTGSNILTWTASSAGNREFFVEVKDGTGKVVRSTSMNVTVTSSATLAVTGKASVSSASVGSSISFTATASGGSGIYTYSYIMHNKDTNDWYRFSDFNSLNTLTWTASSAGNREFFVEVKDSTGKVVRSSAMNVTVNAAISKPLSITGKSSAYIVGRGTSIVLTGTAAGGTGSYTYSFLVQNLDTNEWYRFSGFTSANKMTWTASSAGNRAFFIEVKDSTGKVVRSSAINVSVR
ncbi:MAG: starch-binding protein [Lachnospiraceae bacterium]|nr:starch-binding protein [Lachnospiraceae bacterium]